MVGIGDSAIEVGELVVNHIFQVAIVKVMGEPLTESYRQAFVEEIKIAVYKGGRNGDHSQVDYLLIFDWNYTRFMKSPNFKSMIALTILPLTLAI